MTLIERLREFLKYPGDSINLSERANWGRSLENSRLERVHAALVEFVSTISGTQECHACAACKSIKRRALDDLEQVLQKEQGE